MEPADEEPDKQSELRVFLFGVGRDKLEAAVAEIGIPVAVVNELRRADAVLTTKDPLPSGFNLGANRRVCRNSGVRAAQEHDAPGA